MQTETSATKAETRKPPGRPSTYNEETAELICQRISNGETLRDICRDSYMPARSCVYKWMRKNPPFEAMYARARERLVEHWADEIIGIADDGTTDYVTKIGRHGTEYEAVDQEHIQRSRLRVDTRKWLMSKLVPRVYGDNVEVEVTGGVTVQHELSDRERMRRMALFLLQDEAAGAVIDGQASPIESQATPPAEPEPTEPDQA